MELPNDFFPIEDEVESYSNKFIIVRMVDSLPKKNFFLKKIKDSIISPDEFCEIFYSVKNAEFSGKCYEYLKQEKEKIIFLSFKDNSILLNEKIIKLENKKVNNIFEVFEEKNIPYEIEEEIYTDVIKRAFYIMKDKNFDIFHLVKNGNSFFKLKSYNLEVIFSTCIKRNYEYKKIVPNVPIPTETKEDDFLEKIAKDRIIRTKEWIR